MLSRIDIINLYNLYLKKYCNDNFLNKYNRFPLEKNYHKWWDWKGKDFPRVISLLEFEEFALKYRFNPKKLMTINGPNDPENLFINSEIKVDIEYISNPEIYDLHIMNLKEKDFDFILVNQTFEHLYNPFASMKTLNNHLVKGGLLYVNVPCLNIPHDTPFHYYTGFTPIGLLSMFIDSGFEIIEAGQWGNEEYVQKLFSMKDWPDYTMLNNPGLNELNCPVITWVLGRKIENNYFSFIY